MKENDKPEERWLVIVNPHAGSGKGRKDWPGIRKLLIEKKFRFKEVLTKARFHAINIAKDQIEKGCRKIIVVGGDGTLNEVVNGVFIQKKYPTKDITIGMITVGTGNDWGRMYRIPFKYKKAIKVLKKGKTFVQDAGKVRYQLNGNTENRYFVNMAGMGFDALVAQKTNALKEKGRGGTTAYLYNLMTGLFQYKITRLKIDVDNKDVFDGDVFSMSLGICKYNGGGMMQLPDAIPDDGLFDLTVIRKTSKFKIIRNIKNLYDGSFVKLDEVSTFRGSYIRVVSIPEKSVFLETDGESLGHSPLEFEIIPSSVKVIVNKKFLKGE
ncbi:MAG: diacylglycerol kinase family lipid kinase [Bacteroidales bacterium]|nr:diacylglycerol kinase family lipid kinase [Bacteroidales bacterium]MCF8387068.1 diacylglycerol kinase family lipid kinase [Bacteroidales bacterium]MCF8397752.1 diacylglycerol kinase family lipid kinase [Bacteroidales bacterium]